MKRSDWFTKAKLALLATVLSCSGERRDAAAALDAALVARAAEFELDTGEGGRG